MQQPVQPPVTMRTVPITCFTCNKDIHIRLKSWELTKKIECPLCHGKEVIIGSKLITNL